jgi:phosphomannomutase
MESSLRFGTSGLRGLVDDFTPDAVDGWTGRFLSRFATPDGLMVGRDLRESSPAIAAMVCAAAAARGLPVIDCGALPTPALALAAQRASCAAIMVTGSHIPADRNGLKFYTAAGELTKAEEAMVVAAAPMAVGSKKAAIRDDAGVALSSYRARYLAHASLLDLSGLHVGVYEHSSVARDLLPDLLERLGARVTRLGRSDAFVPVDTEAVAPEDRDRAAAWAAEHGLDAIVSTDGDADRPLIADEAGRFLRGDLVGLATARFLGASTVVTPVTSSSAPELSGAFARVVRTRVGSPHVIEAMRACEGTVVGYEANGGVMLGSDIGLASGTLEALPTRDAALPILAVLAFSRAGGTRVSRVQDAFPRRFTGSDRLTDVSPADWLRVAATLDGALPDQLAPAGSLVAIDRTARGRRRHPFPPVGQRAGIALLCRSG